MDSLNTPLQLRSLDEIRPRYAAILCDVWGVIHNGIDRFDEACDALERARAAGVAVILVTNAPRRAREVEAFLAHLDVPRNCWDRIVTSGDVTRHLVAEGPRRIFHLGPDGDLGLFDGLDVELVEEFEAAGVVCTGLFDDENEQPEDYADLLLRLRSRNLPFICANPDIVVERGDRLIPCAGALARDYAQLGGRIMIAGKPHEPIYRSALAAASEVAGREIAAGEALAIGDGVLTDVKGALSNGIDVIFITAGIHAADYDASGRVDAGRLGAFLTRHALAPTATMSRLA